ncbi:metal ABC transporter ATP-binding protein [Thalassospira marina]|uniref:ABC transporter n=1 Tax=Thalassospira marina TaxID=2048283 RepID=A0A2N3KWI4_9PROT|nr:ATP-binding cassette domain-containing protein [Thalassospira marina]PKR54888.1 ABC transporter [Thalassospira marina]
MIPARIHLQNVAIDYGGDPVIRGLSGCFAPGSLTAIAGENGRGKSTLIKGIIGELPLSGGQISKGGMAGTDIAYLAQTSTLERSFPFTVADTVILGAWAQTGAFRAVTRTIAKRAYQAMCQVGLEKLENRPISTLSAGQLQRVLFARLILQDAPVILLDEPFTAIDTQTTQDLIGVIRGWHRDGRTVIAVLHDFDHIRSHFPQTLFLHAHGNAWGDTQTILPAAPQWPGAQHMQVPGHLASQNTGNLHTTTIPAPASASASASTPSPGHVPATPSSPTAASPSKIRLMS